MANLPETESYDVGVYQIETTDAVVGGADGISNKSARNLANRTKWLKAQIDALVTASGNWLVNPGLVSQADAEAGILPDVKMWSPLRVRQAINAGVNALWSLVSQAEAEAGTATTVRLWTAQRVKQAILANQISGGLGVGQSVQNVLSQRNVDIAYENATGKTIFVSVFFRFGASAEIHFKIDNITFSVAHGDAGYTRGSFYLPVPAGSSYKISVIDGDGLAFYSWSELR